MKFIVLDFNFSTVTLVEKLADGYVVILATSRSKALEVSKDLSESVRHLACYRKPDIDFDYFYNREDFESSCISLNELEDMAVKHYTKWEEEQKTIK